MDFLKSTVGKVLSAALALAVVAGAISWWRMDESVRHDLVAGTGKVIGWLLGVLLWPWATFFVIGRVAKMESNLAGGLLVFGYTLLEGIILLWLFGWSLPGPTAWTFATIGTLFAGVYNLLSCDWIAEKAA
ncbi:MAG: hypothetical protein IT447_04370 [Phycisphaerales bacterium]|jgi:FtsH-binding integral membrane protein|nr:hypothetical protein [Phycisphaerales bacterium]